MSGEGRTILPLRPSLAEFNSSEDLGVTVQEAIAVFKLEVIDGTPM